MLTDGTRAVLVLGFNLAFSTLASVGAASELSWVGPADCAESEQLVFQVERALGASLARVAHLRFQVHVERSVPDARALLRVAAGDESATKERLLAAPDCGALVDTLAVAVALAIDAAASTVEPVRAVPPEVSSASAASASPEQMAASKAGVAAGLEDVPASSEAALAGPVSRAAFWLVGDAGSLPAPAAGMALGLEVGWRRLQLRLLGTLWVEQHEQMAAANQPAAGADLNLAAGTLLACTTPLGAVSGPVGVSLCGGWEIGAMSGAGTGVSSSRQATALWWAPRVEAGVFWDVPASQLRVGAQLGAAMPLNRDAFVLDEIGTVHRPAAVAARAGLSVDVALE